METAIPLEKFSKGKKGRLIRSAKAMNEVVDALPRNQTWTVKLPQNAGIATFKWSKADKEQVVLDLTKMPLATATLLLQVDINGTIYDVKFLINSIAESADQ